MADEFARDMLRLFNTMSFGPAEHRTSSVVAAAYIETHVTDLIRRKMPGLTKALTKRVFHPEEGFINTLGRKLDMCEALEILESRYIADARQIGRIRNKFAHTLEVDSFDHPKVRDLIDALKATTDFRLRTEKGLVDPLEQAETREKKFITSAIAVAMHIVGEHIPGDEYAFSDLTLVTGNGRDASHSISVSRVRPKKSD